VLQSVANQIAVLQNEIAEIDGRILIWHRSSEVSQRLAGMPGVGPIVASAIAAGVPDASVFRCGREFAAWLGLVPKQSGTGRKTWLGRIYRETACPFP
jgi:transposase